MSITSLLHNATSAIHDIAEAAPQYAADAMTNPERLLQPVEKLLQLERDAAAAERNKRLDNQPEAQSTSQRETLFSLERLLLESEGLPAEAIRLAFEQADFALDRERELDAQNGKPKNAEEQRTHDEKQRIAGLFFQVHEFNQGESRWTIKPTK